MMENLFQILLDSEYKSNIEKVNIFFLDRIIPSLDEGAWFVNKIAKRNEKFGKRAAAFPNQERSLLFFRRKGIHFNSFNFFGFDWIVTVGILSFIISK